MVKNMKGWRVGRGHEMTESVLKKDNHCLGGGGTSRFQLRSIYSLLRLQFFSFAFLLCSFFQI